MHDPKGFLNIVRKDRDYTDPEDRIKNWKEFVIPLSEEDVKKQASRCMDCGIPYCHGPVGPEFTGGCPVNNQIPDWNGLVSSGQWKEALENLHSTNNFPEFTGKICPAPCQVSCTLNLVDSPVSIKTIEDAIITAGWENGWVKPLISKGKNLQKIAIIGSGPAGLACAQQLARAGYSVTIFEKFDKPGGLLWYGIPDFKMEKGIILRRVSQMMAEGVEFQTRREVGVNFKVKDLDEFDIIVLAIGAEEQRELNIPGRELKGIHLAMEYLIQSNKRVNGERVKEEEILATGKKVLVIGGGDTGSDCVGTAFRQGAKSVTQLTYHAIPPEKEDKLLTWPYWPMKLWTSSSHEEGCVREWALQTKQFVGNGVVQGIEVTKLEWENVAQRKYKEIPNSQFVIEADLILLSIGFSGVKKTSLLTDLGVELPRTIGEEEGSYQTSNPRVFYAGDARRGASLVVWAIREGRQAAHYIDKLLKGYTDLPLL